MFIKASNALSPAIDNTPHVWSCVLLPIIPEEQNVNNVPDASARVNNGLKAVTAIKAHTSKRNID